MGCALSLHMIWVSDIQLLRVKVHLMLVSKCLANHSLAFGCSLESHSQKIFTLNNYHSKSVSVWRLKAWTPELEGNFYCWLSSSYFLSLIIFSFNTLFFKKIHLKKYITFKKSLDRLRDYKTHAVKICTHPIPACLWWTLDLLFCPDSLACVCCHTVYLRP